MADKTLADQLNDLAASVRAGAAPPPTPAGAGADPALSGVAKGLFGGTPQLPARAPFGTTGPVQASRGYSILRAAAYSLGIIGADDCKEEIHAHQVLKSLSTAQQFGYQGRSFLIPFSTAHIDMSYNGAPLQSDPNKVSFVRELQQKMAASVDEAGWEEAHNRRQVVEKALGTVDDLAGGSFRAPPSLGEIIDLQRNAEIFSRAGAREVTLPPSGHITYPRQTGSTVVYNVGEAAAIVESQMATGSLILSAKKVAAVTRVNNELFRFASTANEAMLRNDIAQATARKLDQDMLYGTGGTTIKGLTTYPTQSSWSEGSSDKIILYVSLGSATNGDMIQPEDVEEMLSMLADEVEPTAFLMRRRLYAKLTNRRADAVTAADAKGAFVTGHDRTAQGGSGNQVNLSGVNVVRSSNVRATLTKGSSGATLTEIIYGDFNEWIIGRLGVMEFMTTQGETAFLNDQILLRGIQHVDAGPRTPASFGVCQNLLTA